jgi:hypothetical protein
MHSSAARSDLLLQPDSLHLCHLISVDVDSVHTAHARAVDPSSQHPHLLLAHPESIIQSVDLFFRFDGFEIV